jgi:hypothetical protein
MKARVENRVPLTLGPYDTSQPGARRETGGDYVFAGQRDGRPLSNIALAMMRRMSEATSRPTNFDRTSLAGASEVTSFSSELRETALAHTIKNKAERAYRRGDALEKRREMVEAWANWCIKEP